MIMVHGDNKGLILPPRVAPTQIVIVPIYSKVNYEPVTAKGREVEAAIKAAGLRVDGDYRSNYKPGWKYNHWETKGVPIRLEIGERDINNNQVVIVFRHSGVKETLSMDNLIPGLQDALQRIHNEMFRTHFPLCTCVMLTQ